MFSAPGSAKSLLILCPGLLSEWSSGGGIARNSRLVGRRKAVSYNLLKMHVVPASGANSSLSDNYVPSRSESIQPAPNGENGSCFGMGCQFLLHDFSSLLISELPPAMNEAI